MKTSRQLLATASFFCLALASPPAAAQDAPPPENGEPAETLPAPAPPSAAQAAAPGGEDIVVTGSRIPRPETSFAYPIQSYTSQAIQQSGDVNITDFLVDTPALVGSYGSSQTSGSNGFFESAGLNLLDLRNLGLQRTLVLVNGRRHVAGYPGSAAVDVNTIPLDLIERVDVLTGGTSAIYGADGVSGVVNFVLKRDFQGIRARGQIGISQRGDAGNRFGSLVAGTNFAGGRGNVAVAYEYTGSSELTDRDRPYTGDPLKKYELLRQAPPTDRPDDPNIPDQVLFNDARWIDSSPDSALDLGSVVGGVFVPGEFDGRPDFTGSGAVYDRGLILPSSGGRTIGGSGTPTAGYFGDFLPRLERHAVNLLGSFTFAPALRLFVEGKYVHSDAFTISQPTFDFGTYLAPDNAYLVRRFGTELSAGGALVTGRDNLDFGIRGDDSRRETLRGVIGFDGRLGDHARYELSYVYGRTRADTTSVNDRYADRYFAALDAVVNPANGQITCRINLPGETVIDPNNWGDIPRTFQPGQCVPLDILGKGVASPEALRFVLANETTHSRITQQVASGYVSGDLGFAFELPGGPVGFAVGAEYRREGARSVPSDALQQGYLLDSSQIAITAGHFDVKEAYGEIEVPILKGVPLADTLSVGGAVRFSDYSTVGSTTTWKVEGVYAPIPDIRFRGTWSKAVRAPNIGELFSPLSGTFQFINDPCDILNRTSGSPTRAANCVAQLKALGLSDAQIAAFSPSSDSEASTSRPGITGGNPGLQEESGRTWTAGVVLRPRFAPGLAITADWYDIRLSNTINTFTAQQAFELCVDQPTLDNIFCSLIQRDPATGFAKTYTLRPENIAKFLTAGLDVTLTWRFTPSPEVGTFNLRLVGGYLDHLTFINTPGATPDEDVGELDPAPAPKYLGTVDLTWTRGPLSINYGLAWQSRVRRFTREQLAANPDIAEKRFLRYRQRWEHDLQLSYDVDPRFNLYAGVNNFTDQKPSVSSGGAYPVSPVGRYLYVGVRLNLGDWLGL